MTHPPLMLAGTTPLYDLCDKSYVIGLAGMDIDGDGSGGNAENDPDFQPTTTLVHADGTYVNSRTERGFVVPRKFALAVPGIVIGCRGEIFDTFLKRISPAVVHDIGPDDKAGEATICAAEFFEVPSNPTTGGTQIPRFLYRFWPGQAATVNGITYPLIKL